MFLANLCSGVALWRIHWSFGPVVPIAKDCRTTAVVGDDIITVGGTLWAATAAGDKVKKWTSTVFQLNTRKLEWSNLPAYPLPVGYAVAAGIGSRIYVAGGRDQHRGYPEMYVLDMATKDPVWVPAVPLPESRWGDVGAAMDGVLYVAGGSLGNPLPQAGEHLAGDVLALDTRRSAQGWKRVAMLPHPQTQWQMGAACAGRFYLFGGMVPAPATSDKGFLPLAEAFVLDVSTGKWRSLRPLPLPMGSGAATAIDSRFIVISGGYTLALAGSRTPDHKARTYYTAECFLYDTERNVYTSLPPMKVPVNDQGCAYLNHRLFIFGGEDTAFQTRTDLLQIGEPL